MCGAPVNDHNAGGKKTAYRAVSESRTTGSLDPLAQSFDRWQYPLGQMIIMVCCPGEDSKKLGSRDQHIKGSAREGPYLF